MQTETRRTPGGGVILVSLLGALLAFVPVGLGTLVVGLSKLKAGTLAQSLEMMGPWGQFVRLAMGFAVLGTLVAFLVSAWKPRVPGALFAGLGLLPWVVGVTGTLSGLRMTAEAAEQVNFADRATIAAAGTSEALLTTLFGGMLSALLLLGMALGLGLLAVVSAGRPVDARVSGVPALLCAGLALAVGGQVLPWNGKQEAFAALAYVNPIDRLTILSAAVEELSGVRGLSVGMGWLSLVLLLAAGVWGARQLQGASRLGRGAAAVLVVGAALGWSAQVRQSIAIFTHMVTTLPWEREPGFQPVLVLGESGEEQELDAVVTPTHLALRGNAPVPLDQAEAALRQLFKPEKKADADAAVSDEKKQSALRMLARMNLGAPPAEDEAYIPGMPIKLRLVPSVALAVDERVTSAQLGAVLDAARAAGARSVLFAGMSASTQKLETLFEPEPLLERHARAMAVRLSGRVALLSAVPRGALEHDPFMWHARLEAPGAFTVRPRPGTPGEPRTLNPKASPEEAEVPRERDLDATEATPVYLALGGKDVLAQDVITSIERVTRAFPGQPVVLVHGALPESTEKPWRVPGSERLDAGGGGGGEGVGLGTLGMEGHGRGSGEGPGPLPGRRKPLKAAEALAPTGTLSKEAIRDVIHRYRMQVRYCYESQLERHPALAGKVVMRFTIAASGTVESAEVSESTVGNDELHRCLAQRVRSWKFPAFDGGQVKVSYPFMFTAATK
jgi:TonB family protein